MSFIETSRRRIAARRLKKATREIERLARDICWAEFPRKPKDTTKSAYWASVHPDKRAEYIEDAKWLIFIVKKLKPVRVIGFVDHRDEGAAA